MPGNPAFGGTVLRIPAEQSPNFVHLISGWFIGQDGSAEFNDVTIRGGEVVNGSALYYSPSEGAGNLVLSVNGNTANTTDSFGNVVLPGTTTYADVGGTFYAMQTYSTNITLYSATSQAGPYSSQGIIEMQSGQGLTIRDLSGNGLSIDTSGGPIVIDPTGSAAITIEGALTVTAPITATSGTAASPTVITTDTWHAMTLANSWANVAGFATARYRLTAANQVEIIGAINAAAASAVTFFTLPAAYRPASQQPVAGAGANASVPAGLSPWIRCDTSGNLTVQNTGAIPAAFQLFFHGFISLDA